MNQKPPLLWKARLYLASRIDHISWRVLLLALKVGTLKRRRGTAQEPGGAGRASKTRKSDKRTEFAEHGNPRLGSH